MNIAERLKKLTPGKFILLAILAALWAYGLVDNYAAGHTMAYLAVSAAIVAAVLVPWRAIGQKLLGLAGIG